MPGDQHLPTAGEFYSAIGSFTLGQGAGNASPICWSHPPYCRETKELQSTELSPSTEGRKDGRTVGGDQTDVIRLREDTADSALKPAPFPTT